MLVVFRWKANSARRPPDRNSASFVAAVKRRRCFFFSIFFASGAGCCRCRRCRSRRCCCFDGPSPLGSYFLCPLPLLWVPCLLTEVIPPSCLSALFFFFWSTRPLHSYANASLGGEKSDRHRRVASRRAAGMRENLHGAETEKTAIEMKRQR